MHYTISKEQIEQALKALESHDDRADDAIAMLQGLLAQPEGEPDVYQWRSPFAPDKWIPLSKEEIDTVEKTDAFRCEPKLIETRRLYTHPAPFTPITADMVTGGMIHEWRANTFGAQSMGGVTDKDMIIAAVNAFMPSYLGAKK